MKVSQAAAKALSSAIKEFGEKQTLEDGAEVHLLEDANVAFGTDSSGQRVFQGLSFEMVGRDFHVLPNLDLVVSEATGGTEGAQDEVYVIEDQTFADLAGEYLLWRAKFLRELKV